MVLAVRFCPDGMAEWVYAGGDDTFGIIITSFECNNLERSVARGAAFAMGVFVQSAPNMWWSRDKNIIRETLAGHEREGHREGWP